jgi:putative transposase
MAHEAEEYPAMSQSTTEIRIASSAPSQNVLTALLRVGARRLLAQAGEAEVAAWIDDHAHLKDDQGRRQVVRNGHLPERAIQSGIGSIKVRQPRVHDRRPAKRRDAFSSE